MSDTNSAAEKQAPREIVALLSRLLFGDADPNGLTTTQEIVNSLSRLGYEIVPRVATAAILRAGKTYIYDDSHDALPDAWQRMVAAAVGEDWRAAWDDVDHSMDPDDSDEGAG